MEAIQILSTVGKYATPEVITVFGALLTAWVGWKVAAKSIGLIGAFAQKASFVGLTAAVLFVAGLGGAGVGTGELVARITNSPSKAEKTGLSDEKLLQLAKDCHNTDTAKLITDYARARDGQGNEDVQILAKLVEKQMTDRSNFDKDGNNTALVAFLEYLKAKEVNKSAKTKLDNTLVQTVSLTTTDGTVPVSLDNPPSLAEPQAKNKDSLLSIPVSLGLIGCGIASCICGICCWNRRTIR